MAINQRVVLKRGTQRVYGKEVEHWFDSSISRLNSEREHEERAG